MIPGTDEEDLPDSSVDLTELLRTLNLTLEDLALGHDHRLAENLIVDEGSTDDQPAVPNEPGSEPPAAPLASWLALAASDPWLTPIVTDGLGIYGDLLTSGSTEIFTAQKMEDVSDQLRLRDPQVSATRQPVIADGQKLTGWLQSPDTLLSVKQWFGDRDSNIRRFEWLMYLGTLEETELNKITELFRRIRVHVFGDWRSFQNRLFSDLHTFRYSHLFTLLEHEDWNVFMNVPAAQYPSPEVRPQSPVVESQLSCGLRVIKTSRSTDHRVVIQVNTGDSHDLRPGTAHLIEHLVFHNWMMDTRILQGVTKSEYVQFSTAQNSFEEVLEKVVEFVDSVKKIPMMSQNTIDREIQVIDHETAAQEPLVSLLNKLGHRDNHYPLGGSLSTLSGITVEEISRYLATFYRPDNMIVVLDTSESDEVANARLEEAFSELLWPQGIYPYESEKRMNIFSELHGKTLTAFHLPAMKPSLVFDFPDDLYDYVVLLGSVHPGLNLFSHNLVQISCSGSLATCLGQLISKISLFIDMQFWNRAIQELNLKSPINNDFNNDLLLKWLGRTALAGHSLDRSQAIHRLDRERIVEMLNLFTQARVIVVQVQSSASPEAKTDPESNLRYQLEDTVLQEIRTQEFSVPFKAARPSWAFETRMIYQRPGYETTVQLSASSFVTISPNNSAGKIRLLSKFLSDHRDSASFASMTIAVVKEISDGICFDEYTLDTVEPIEGGIEFTLDLDEDDSKARLNCILRLSEAVSDHGVDGSEDRLKDKRSFVTPWRLRKGPFEPFNLSEVFRQVEVQILYRKPSFTEFLCLVSLAGLAITKRPSGPWVLNPKVLDLGRLSLENRRLVIVGTDPTLYSPMHRVEVALQLGSLQQPDALKLLAVGEAIFLMLIKKFYFFSRGFIEEIPVLGYSHTLEPELDGNSVWLKAKVRTKLDPSEVMAMLEIFMSRIPQYLEDNRDKFEQHKSLLAASPAGLRKFAGTSEDQFNFGLGKDQVAVASAFRSALTFEDLRNAVQGRIASKSWITSVSKSSVSQTAMTSLTPAESRLIIQDAIDPYF